MLSCPSPQPSSGQRRQPRLELVQDQADYAFARILKGRLQGPIARDIRRDETLRHDVLRRYYHRLLQKNLALSAVNYGDLQFGLNAIF
jgi:hypothetical protein